MPFCERALRFRYQSLGCVHPRVIKDILVTFPDRLRDGLDLAEISASVGNVAQRPGSETIEEIVLEQNGHRLPAKLFHQAQLGPGVENLPRLWRDEIQRINNTLPKMLRTPRTAMA
jgi:hypothetical protein